MKTGPLTALPGIKTPTSCIQPLGKMRSGGGRGSGTWLLLGFLAFPTPSPLAFNLALSTLLMDDPRSQLPPKPCPSLSCSCEIVVTDPV